MTVNVTPNTNANVEGLCCDLEAILADIQCARSLLLHPPSPSSPSPPKTASRASFKSTKSSKSLKSLNKLKSPPIPKRLFSRVSAPFRLVRSRSQRKRYDKMEDTRSLISDDRRGSADSDATLVGFTGSGTDAHLVDTAGQLLEILAPLVSSLQKLSPRLKAVGQIEDLVKDHGRLCDKLVELFDDLAVHHQAQEDSHDEHDLEMTSLMLDALRKKVDQERSAFQHRPMLVDQEVEAEETVIDNNRSSDESPLLPVSKNPFVVHSTSIALSSSRRSSVSTSIPIGEQAVPPGTYSAFIGGAQQTWARNVIRIGSYQSSMLFSPSPVAVRPLAAFGRP